MSWWSPSPSRLSRLPPWLDARSHRRLFARCKHQRSRRGRVMSVRSMYRSRSKPSGRSNRVPYILGRAFAAQNPRKRKGLERAAGSNPRHSACVAEGAPDGGRGLEPRARVTSLSPDRHQEREIPERNWALQPLKSALAPSPMGVACQIGMTIVRKPCHSGDSHFSVTGLS